MTSVGKILDDLRKTEYDLVPCMVCQTPTPNRQYIGNCNVALCSKCMANEYRESTQE